MCEIALLFKHDIGCQIMAEDMFISYFKLHT